MALHRTPLRNLPQLASRCQRTARLPSLQGQSFLSLSRSNSSIARGTVPAYKNTQQLRAFSQYAALRQVRNQSDEAPNAKAYLDSGAILGGRNLVDVKKVLVIGSGGLAIGQAGEFDYSGMFIR
jgi:carbamoyl-phosphate synthase large subunit